MTTRANGFSLLELMVTLAVLAILSTIAYPNMRDFMRRNRAVAQACFAKSFWAARKASAVAAGADGAVAAGAGAATSLRRLSGCAFTAAGRCAL